MKRYLLGLLLVADVGICANSATTYDYVCEKGSKKISYRLAFQKADGEPPCKVYEVWSSTITLI